MLCVHLFINYHHRSRCLHLPHHRGLLSPPDGRPLSYEPTFRVTTLFLATTAHRLWNRSCTLPSHLVCWVLVGGGILSNVPSFGGPHHSHIQCWHSGYTPTSASSPEAVETLSGWPRLSSSFWQGLLRVMRHFECRCVDQSSILQLCGLPSRGLTP